MKYDLTKIPIAKALAALAIPIIAANILHTAYSLIDITREGGDEKNRN